MTSPWTTTPSVELQPVRKPAVMLMWASSRVVVVLPLVPVTEATGMRGVTRRGPSPSGEAAATPAARSATASAKGRPASRSPSTSPIASPSASARARCRQTKAHTTTSVSFAARVRTPSRRVPTSAARAAGHPLDEPQEHLLALLGPGGTGLAATQAGIRRDTRSVSTGASR